MATPLQGRDQHPPTASLRLEYHDCDGDDVLDPYCVAADKLSFGYIGPLPSQVLVSNGIVCYLYLIICIIIIYIVIYIYIPIYIYWLFDWNERLMVSFCSWWMAVGDKVDSGVRIWKFHDTARLRWLCPQWLSGKWPRVTMHLTWALSRVGRKTNYADFCV